MSHRRSWVEWLYGRSTYPLAYCSGACRGFILLRVNMRGAGPARALARKPIMPAPVLIWPSSSTGQNSVSKNSPHMMGHLPGGTAALNMALDHPGVTKLLAGLVTVGALIDMRATARKFHRPRNWLYLRHMLAGMKQIVATTPHIEQRYVDAAMRATNFFTFDDQVTAPLPVIGTPAAITLQQVFINDCRS